MSATIGYSLGQFLEHRRAGGVAGFGFLRGRNAQLLEEDRLELFRGADVKNLACLLANLGLDFADLRRRVLSESLPASWPTSTETPTSSISARIGASGSSTSVNKSSRPSSLSLASKHGLQPENRLRLTPQIFACPTTRVRFGPASGGAPEVPGQGTRRPRRRSRTKLLLASSRYAASIVSKVTLRRVHSPQGKRRGVELGIVAVFFQRGRAQNHRRTPTNWPGSRLPSAAPSPLPTLRGSITST